MDDNTAPQSGNWKDLLEDYLKNGAKTPVKKEDNSIDLFLEYINNTDDKNKEEVTSQIPKFYYKRPISYNDLYFSVKSEAKSRFLSIKSFEIPQKKRNFLFNDRFEGFMARAKK